MIIGKGLPVMLSPTAALEERKSPKWEAFAPRKPIGIRFLHSTCLGKLKGKLVSKCLTTMKCLPAYRTLIGYFSIISLWETPQGNLRAGLHLKLEPDYN